MSGRNRQRWVAAVVILVWLVASEFAVGSLPVVGRGAIYLRVTPFLVLLAWFIASWD